MSSYIRTTKHPVTDEYEDAFWVDDHFGSHQYGVVFKDGLVVNPSEVDVPTKPGNSLETTWDDYPSELHDIGEL